VRTGQDVLKALALGAKGCLVGKSFLYSLAAMGEAGVALMLDIIRKELAVSLALTGANDVRKVTREILVQR
jgi:L-lactate dehydrogenase (cytochrome)